MLLINKNYRNNFIDEKLQAALLPLNLFQNIFFQSKYTIKNNFVYPKSYMYNIVSFIFIVLLLYCHFFHMRIEDVYFKRMFENYINIIESFDLFKIIFQVPSTGILLEIYVLGWMVKNLLLLSLCVKECEDFYTNVIEAEVQCMLHSENNECEGMKTLYKNVRRLNRAKYSKMTACRIFTVDAVLPLRCIDIFAVYTIVLLQFAFQSNK
ncbi:uncharacterized protein LOC126777448 [Nymphalis io]|uniref:uncharacterized protein LOC126777448 n=1 Tax=Inachis io TaxID=171585 RepID=UPI002169FA96|nr:uncharacterized protein LOC126777448 [Nymphalis io]